MLLPIPVLALRIFLNMLYYCVVFCQYLQSIFNPQLLKVVCFVCCLLFPFFKTSLYPF